MDGKRAKLPRLDNEKLLPTVLDNINTFDDEPVPETIPKRTGQKRKLPLPVESIRLEEKDFADLTESRRPLAQDTNRLKAHAIQDIVKVGTRNDIDEVFSGSAKKAVKGVILREYSQNLLVKDGRYDIDQQWEKKTYIGKGGSGEVWMCQDKTSKFEFCTKEIQHASFEKKEVLSWNLLNNEHICKMYGAVKVYNNNNFIKVIIFMENGGKNIREILKKQWQPRVMDCKKERFTLVTALKYHVQLLNALCTLEESLIVHNDIKSNNILILVDETKEVLKVIDFGESFPEHINMHEEDRNVTDVINATWLFREMLTGYRRNDPTYSKSNSSGTNRVTEDGFYDPHFIPTSLNLPYEVKQIFRKGWQKDSSQKWHASGLLPITTEVIKGMESEHIIYKGPNLMKIEGEEEED